MLRSHYTNASVKRASCSSCLLSLHGTTLLTVTAAKVEARSLSGKQHQDQTAAVECQKGGMGIIRRLIFQNWTRRGSKSQSPHCCVRVSTFFILSSCSQGWPCSSVAASATLLNRIRDLRSDSMEWDVIQILFCGTVSNTSIPWHLMAFFIERAARDTVIVMSCFVNKSSAHAFRIGMRLDRVINCSSTGTAGNTLRRTIVSQQAGPGKAIRLSNAESRALARPRERPSISPLLLTFEGGSVQVSPCGHVSILYPLSASGPAKDSMCFMYFQPASWQHPNPCHGSVTLHILPFHPKFQIPGVWRSPALLCRNCTSVLSNGPRCQLVPLCKSRDPGFIRAEDKHSIESFQPGVQVPVCGVLMWAFEQIS